MPQNKTYNIIVLHFIIGLTLCSPSAWQAIPHQSVFSQTEFLQNSNNFFLEVTVQRLPHRLHSTYIYTSMHTYSNEGEGEDRAHVFQWTNMDQLLSVSETVKPWLPSMTAYCRHTPGVTFKTSVSFLSILKCGASWQHKNRPYQCTVFIVWGYKTKNENLKKYYNINLYKLLLISYETQLTLSVFTVVRLFLYR